MTQAPTPGPLSASDVKLLVKGDLLRVTNADSFLEANGVKDGSVVRFRSADNTWIDLQEMDFPQGSSFARFAFIGRPDESGWMPWSGGDPTITDPTVDIEVRLRNGELHVDRSPAFDWTYDPEPHPFDIIAFRLAPTAPVEASGSEEIDLYDDKVQEGISWTMRQWGEALGLTTWTQGDGSESVEGDVGAEIHTILVDAGLRDAETNEMAALRPQPSGETRAAVARIIADHVAGGFDAALQDKQEWKDRSGLGYDCEPSDVNGPFKDDYLDAADAILALRPQPSGETREDVARELWDYQIAARRKKSLSIPKELGSRILALLSARPLALGGQQGVGEADRKAAEWPSCVACEDKPAPGNNPCAVCGLTTPARAEAQDEGAATDDLVDRFAVALKAKLRAAGEKYGFDDAWKADDWRDKLIEDLLRHIQKGDPRDVAAYCAFAWHHDWSLSPKQDDLRSAAFTDRGAEDRYVSQDEGTAGDLKPCPFCGGEAEIIHLDDGDNAGGSCVCCTKCQASGNVEFGRKENFVENWNRRAHPCPTPAADADRVQSVACLTRYSPLSTGNNKAMMQEDEAGLYVLRKQALAALKSTAATEKKTDV